MTTRRRSRAGLRHLRRCASGCGFRQRMRLLATERGSSVEFGTVTFYGVRRYAARLGDRETVILWRDRDRRATTSVAQTFEWEEDPE